MAKQKTFMELQTILQPMMFKVTYGDRSHLTPYDGAKSLLEGRLESAGVGRDALGAVLRDFTDKCLNVDVWNFPYEAGVITIEKATNP